MFDKIRDEYKKASDEQKAKQASHDTDKTEQLLEKYGLNLSEYTTTDIKDKNAQNLKRIAQDLLGNRLLKGVMGLSFSKVEEQAKVTYLSAIVEQNWILIRQNEAILRQLEKRQ